MAERKHNLLFILNVLVMVERTFFALNIIKSFTRPTRSQELVLMSIEKNSFRKFRCAVFSGKNATAFRVLKMKKSEM